MKLFVNFCEKVLRIDSPVRQLEELGRVKFVNKYLERFYRTQPFTNLAFLGEERSLCQSFLCGCTYKGQPRSQTKFPVERTLINPMFKRHGLMCFQRAHFNHLVLKDVGIESYVACCNLRTTSQMPHNVVILPDLEERGDLYLMEPGNRVCPTLQLVDLNFPGEWSPVYRGPLSDQTFRLTPDGRSSDGSPLYEVWSRKRSGGGGKFRYYCDLDLADVTVVDEGGLSPPMYHAMSADDHRNMMFFTGYCIVILGVNAEGRWVAFLNFEMTKYDPEGRVAVREELRSPEDLTSAIVENFPQFSYEKTSGYVAKFITVQDELKNGKS